MKAVRITPVYLSADEWGLVISCLRQFPAVPRAVEVAFKVQSAMDESFQHARTLEPETRIGCWCCYCRERKGRR